MSQVVKTKRQQEGINSKIALMIKSGKYVLGYKQTLDTIRKGKAKVVLISSNIPPLRKAEIEYYAMLARISVHHYNGTNVTLGTACGKYFRVGTLCCIDQGDSDITSLSS
ncbi:putative large subunit ribosomal protein L30e [Monocercomonoides exilis]|uniref:putative 60S ribosomal protein RPL30 n=1 Tax=Monocercomonoides exilis TaxID=2049356 RepID=UPI00355A73E9|nr:putative 60S ribosomal protein RPL30 [Monocercomonoides exilis]KAH7831726.1 putative large subunit ribosomal protein L30e [Monocercomonoides exilis]|eukprot:MONOS_525.1-p1 / transcript=MONOS_525.1 / gene=MONOS_525 / organism=Monocercomonoides_exilis_PA203 / gene_product=large subunit ribosomal protein L30e / transcript_product=large subunit ribosomal protein L30e / location=Mono_scaffold00008:173883-174522(+) / protein_length=110 / sequence_SO=supercontig / SO=protein_coding / is_pseudo=false